MSTKSPSSPYRLEIEPGVDDDHPERYMSEQMRYRMKNDETLTKEDKMIIQYLAMRKFHIPGNSYWQDYFYWYVDKSYWQ
jgi:hypothetical protein